MRVERGRDYGKKWGHKGFDVQDDEFAIGQNKYDDYNYGVPVPGYIRDCYNVIRDSLYGTAEVELDSGKEAKWWNHRPYHIGKSYEERQTKYHAGQKRYDLHIVSDGGKLFKTLYSCPTYCNI